MSVFHWERLVMADNGCSGCTKRVVGCHSNCETYKKWLETYHKQVKNQKKKQREYREYFYR